MSRLSLAIIHAIACCSLIANASVVATAAEIPPASHPQFWLIDTRCAPGCGDLDAYLAKIAYWRDESPGGGRWQVSDAAEFQASASPDVPTTVLIHGYDTSAGSAVEHGQEWFRLMRQQAGGRPFRLIVWSWPSDRLMLRPRPDLQIKVCRCDVEAYYLARLLSDLPKGTPLSLVGHSLGCRVASGALQLLAGGPVAGRSLARDALTAWEIAGHPPVRVIMLAPAMNADWLEPDCPCGLATRAVESILVVTNRCDRVLKWYSRLYGRHGPEAMGYVGPASTVGDKLEVVDVACELGRKHNFDLYQESSPVRQRLARYTFLRDTPATPRPLVSGGNDAKTLRTWTDASGKFKIEARFVESLEGAVRLQRSDGRYVRVASDLLCSEDRDFLSEQH